MLEALTNAANHAPGAAVTVSLATDTATEEAVVSLSMLHRRTVPPTGTPAGGGYGLVGLDERVRLAGGRLTPCRPPTVASSSPPAAARRGRRDHATRCPA